MIVTPVSMKATEITKRIRSLESSGHQEDEKFEAKESYKGREDNERNEAKDERTTRLR